MGGGQFYLVDAINDSQAFLVSSEVKGNNTYIMPLVYPSDGSTMDVETFMLRNDFIAGYYYNEADCDEEKYKVTVTLYDENLRRYVTAVSPHFMEVDYDNKLQHIVIADGIDGATYKAPISRIVKLKLFDGEILYKDAVANFFGKLKEGAIRLSDILRVDKNKDKTAGGCVLPFKYITSDGIELTNFTVDTRKGFVTGEDSDYNKHKFEIRLRDVVRMEDGYTESLLGYIEGILPVALTKGHDECTGKQLSDFEGQCCRYDYQSDLNGPCDCDCAG